MDEPSSCCALTGTCLSAVLGAQPVPGTRLGCAGKCHLCVPAHPLGILPLHPCQGGQGRCGSSAWPWDGGCRGVQHHLGQAATGSGPAALYPCSGCPAQHQWLQRPAASRGSSEHHLLIPAWVSVSARRFCPGSSSRSRGGAASRGRLLLSHRAGGTGQLRRLPATRALGTAPQLDLHLPCLLLHGN